MRGAPLRGGSWRARILAVLVAAAGVDAPSSVADVRDVHERLELARDLMSHLEYASACEVLSSVAADLLAPPGVGPTFRRRVLTDWIRCAGASRQREEYLRSVRAALDVVAAGAELDVVLDEAVLAARAIFEAEVTAEGTCDLADQVRAHAAFGLRPHPLRHRVLLARAAQAERLHDPEGLATARRCVEESIASGDAPGAAWSQLLVVELALAQKASWPLVAAELRALTPRIGASNSGLATRVQGLLGRILLECADETAAAALTPVFLEVFKANWVEGVAEWGGPAFTAECALRIASRAGNLRSTTDALLSLLLKEREPSLRGARCVRLRVAEAWAASSEWAQAKAALGRPSADDPTDLADATLLLEELLLLAHLEARANGGIQAKAALGRVPALLRLGIGTPEGTAWAARLEALRTEVAEGPWVEIDQVLGVCRARAETEPACLPDRLGTDRDGDEARPVVALRIDGLHVLVAQSASEEELAQEGRWAPQELEFAGLRLRLVGGRLDLLRDGDPGDSGGPPLRSYLVPSDGWLVVHRDGYARFRARPVLPPRRR